MRREWVQILFNAIDEERRRILASPYSTKLSRRLEALDRMTEELWDVLEGKR